MSSNILPMGMSAQERAVRGMLDAPAVPNESDLVAIQATVLRAVIRDLGMWRDIACNDPEKWSFDALIMMAKRILDEDYPEAIFTGASGDAGPRFVVARRELIREIEATAEG
jgi:hypothetical protein